LVKQKAINLSKPIGRSLPNERGDCDDLSVVGLPTHGWQKILPVDEEFVGGVDHFISSIFNLGVGQMKLFLLWLSATMSYVSVS
jgi:hypothetical protein